MNILLNKQSCQKINACKEINSGNYVLKKYPKDSPNEKLCQFLQEKKLLNEEVIKNNKYYFFETKPDPLDTNYYYTNMFVENVK